MIHILVLFTAWGPSVMGLPGALSIETAGHKLEEVTEGCSTIFRIRKTEAKVSLLNISTVVAISSMVRTCQSLAEAPFHSFISSPNFG